MARKIGIAALALAGICLGVSAIVGRGGGEIATYGWKERSDTRDIVNALESSEKVQHLFALGISMGAAISLQSAAAQPRIEAVVAEDPFANLREVSYDYAGLRRWPWLGMTLFRPASIEGMSAVRAEGGFDPDAVSPKRAVAERPYPVLLICGTADHSIPCPACGGHLQSRTRAEGTLDCARRAACFGVWSRAGGI